MAGERVVTLVAPAGVANIASTIAPRHHGSHRGLLVVPPRPQDTSARLDAIVVPTARPVEHLREAMSLAQRMGCPIVVLSSMRSNAGKVTAHAVELGLTVPVFARDIYGRGTFPQFRTNQILGGTRFARNDAGRAAFLSKSDLGIKRNLGWLMSRMVGWRRVMFLDDDIVDIRIEDVRDATALLDDFPAVGLVNTGFPDNSVVCHAYRAAGGRQSTFIGGGALLIDPQRIDSFFADVYNEDWLFLYHCLGQGSVAMVGEASQDPYDPFANPSRARYEEFGDTLAEGLYFLLDEGRPGRRLDERFWERFIADRRKLIRSACAGVRHLVDAPVVQDRMVESLRAAADSSARIKPRLYTAYLKAWDDDLAVWLGYAAEQRAVTDPEEALTVLGRPGVRRFVPWTPPPLTTRPESVPRPRGRFRSSWAWAPSVAAVSLLAVVGFTLIGIVDLNGWNGLVRHRLGRISLRPGRLRVGRVRDLVLARR